MKTSLFSISLLSVLLLGVTFFFESFSVQEVPLQVSVSHPYFKTGEACMSCHNGLVTPAGEDISFGTDWRSSMMANSARDPYWQAAVRREVMDHPDEQEAIEDECSTCHMPMARFQSNLMGEKGSIFEHLPIGSKDKEISQLAADGVSCTACHQIGSDNLGNKDSFSGGFVIDEESGLGQRKVFGPYEVNKGKSSVMHSATGFQQVASDHIQQSELCATCHTLYTKSLGPNGDVVGELPEQVPFLEWQHSVYRERQSCQSCHMPVVKEKTAVSSVLGAPRESVSRHTFRGGNFFMQRMLNRYRADLHVKALPREMDASIKKTEAYLQQSTARLSITGAHIEEDSLKVSVAVENLAGHKLPTAYPSRRVWIHVKVLDTNGDVIFESGRLQESGLIAGNDNDMNKSQYEPHYTEISTGEQVQIYESIMVDTEDNLTTGLLSGYRYVKDNRLLPQGFDKTTAEQDIAVLGRAGNDDNFIGGSDSIQYLIEVGDAEGPFQIESALWYQPIGYRWAKNLEPYTSVETDRFNTYYDAMSASSGLPIVRHVIQVAASEN